MSYTPEITEISVVDGIGNVVAVLNWQDEACISVIGKSILTNGQDWPELSDAIHAAIKKMEHSTREHQQKVNA